MQATITYLLTEQAQRAQMVATGQPVARKQTAVVDISAEQFTRGVDLEVLVVDEAGHVTADLTYDRYVGKEKIPGPLTVEDLSDDPADYLDDRLISIERALAAYEQRKRDALEQLRELHRQFLAGEAPEGVDAFRNGNAPALSHNIPHAPDCLPADDPLRAELDAWMAARERERAAAREVEHQRQSALVARFLADPDARAKRIGLGAEIYGEFLTGSFSGGLLTEEERQSLVAEATRRKQADEQDKERAKTEAIAAWVREHGTDSQRARLADGLLPRKEALAAMAEFAFAQAGVPEGWNYRVCDDREHECRAVAELTSLDEAAYATWAKIRATLPEGYTVTFWRVRECLLDGDDAETDEYRNPDEPTVAEPVTIASITIPFGPFAFERDVRLEESK